MLYNIFLHINVENHKLQNNISIKKKIINMFKIHTKKKRESSTTLLLNDMHLWITNLTLSIMHYSRLGQRFVPLSLKVPQKGIFMWKQTDNCFT